MTLAAALKDMRTLQPFICPLLAPTFALNAASLARDMISRWQ